MGILLVMTVVVAIPGVTGDAVNTRPRAVVSEDRERAPLLEDN